MAVRLMRALEQASNPTQEYLVDIDAKYFTSVSSLNPRSLMPNLKITRTCIVRNQYLKKMYEYKKAIYKVRHGSVTEHQMFHSTSADNAMSIAINNFDWRRVSRSKYGKGISFSTDPDYANFHSNPKNGLKRAFIIAEVLVSKVCLGHHCLTVPPDNFDTARSANGQVYVKFNDYEFLPKYVIFYDAPDKTKSKFFRYKRH